MHTQEHDIPDHAAGQPGYLARIAAALDEVDAQHRAAMALPYGTDTENAVRAARLASACARASAWWGLLARKAAYDQHPLFLRAAVIAAADKWGSARFWRDAAADWWARAQQRPAADTTAAGATGHPQGVPA